MQFKKNASIETTDTFHDLFYGTIDFDSILEKEDAVKLRNAIDIILTFLNEAEECGVLLEF